MDIIASEHPMPECPCGSQELRVDGETGLVCVNCKTRWELADGQGWEKVEETEQNGDVELVCIVDDCPGTPELYNPKPGLYAVGCPACYTSGPQKLSAEDALQAWVDLVGYSDGDKAEMDSDDGHEHSQFAMDVYSALGQMREQWPPLNSCEEGVTYLKMRYGDFWEWLMAPLQDRNRAVGLMALVHISATAQRIAEDVGLSPMSMGEDETTG